MLVSIVIPTFEERNLHGTLYNLATQSLFQKYPKEVEIIIVDYDPNHTRITLESLKTFHHFIPSRKINMMSIDEKGIAKARDFGIKAAIGNIIVNFDADARFKGNTDLENLIDPILTNDAVITCCDNILDNLEFDAIELGNRITGVAIYEILNQIQKDGLIVTLEPGMCFTKHAYMYSGGFFDVRQAEAIFFSPKLIYNFGLFCKKHVPEATVIVSPRRIKSLDKLGVLSVLNYDNAFREDNKVIKL